MGNTSWHGYAQYELISETSNLKKALNFVNFPPAIFQLILCYSDLTSDKDVEKTKTIVGTEKSLKIRKRTSKKTISIAKLSPREARVVSSNLPHNTRMVINSSRPKKGNLNLNQGCILNQSDENFREKYFKLNDVDAIIISALVRQNSIVRKLYLNKNNIGSEGATAIAESLLTNTTLTYVDLSSNKINNHGAIAISGYLGYNAKVTILNLKDNEINYRGEGEKALARSLTRNKTITIILDFHRKNDGINMMANYIDYHEKKISDSAATLIASVLRNSTTMKEFRLYKNEIGHLGAKAIAEAMRENWSLQSLWLQSNQIGDKGAKALGDTMSKSDVWNLKILYLNRNNITNKGAKALAKGLKKNRFLTHLNLYGNNISDIGAQAIVNSLEKNSFIKQLGLNSNEISKEKTRILNETLKTWNHIDITYSKISEQRTRSHRSPKQSVGHPEKPKVRTRHHKSNK